MSRVPRTLLHQVAHAGWGGRWAWGGWGGNEVGEAGDGDRDSGCRTGLPFHRFPSAQLPDTLSGRRPRSSGTGGRPVAVIRSGLGGSKATLWMSGAVEWPSTAPTSSLHHPGLEAPLHMLSTWLQREQGGLKRTISPPVFPFRCLRKLRPYPAPLPFVGAFRAFPLRPSICGSLIARAE